MLFKTLKKILLLLLVANVFFVNGTTVFAQTLSLTASVRNTDPLKPVLVLTNTSQEPCQIVQSAVGTVAITNMKQEGREISPLPFKVAFDEALEILLAKKLQTVQPNKSVEIQLPVVPYKDGQALQTITWSKETGPVGMLYPLKSDKPYSLEVTYNSPITATSSASMCDTAIGISESAFDIKPVIKLAGIFLIILLLLVIILIFFRRFKKHKHFTKVSIVLLIFLISCSGVARQVQADYSVPESAVGQFDECMALFDRYPDITGPVLDALDGGRIILFVNHAAENYATDWPDGTYHIHWDAFNTYNYYSDDGSSIISTPCDRLFHEMYHIYELMNDTFSREFCGGTGIETKEVMATRAQNRLRVAMGLVPRTHYGTERLPEGECLPPPPEPPDCTDSSCGESTGEPHLKTFDNLRYDFQAVGEFIATRDRQGDFEIQTRQEPWPNTQDVAMNTAVAMRVGSNRVEVQMHQQKMALLLNGKRQPLKNMKLSGGGTIVASTTTGWEDTNVVKVSWPDGSTVTARRIGTFGLNIIVNPALVWTGKLEGLLGNYNDNSKDDLKLKGSVAIITPDFEKLYPAFADSWRVDDKTSLFTYEQGENTKTYTDRSFPDKYVTANDLPNRTAAETLCKSFGIISAELLKNCIFDIALTGRPEFAAASALQNMVKSATHGEMLKLSLAKPGAVATATFTGTTNEKVSLIITHSSLPYQCGGFGIKAPDGQPLATGCIVEGKGFIDATILPVSGTYSVYLDPKDNTTGQIQVELIRVKDFLADITIGGPAVTAKLSKPGALAKLTFSGTKGQRIFIEILSNTLPDQCGGFSVNTSNGSSIDSACTTKGKGTFNEKGILLPETGKYTIIIDPAEANTGEITIKTHF